MHAPRVVLDTNVVLSALLFASGRLVWLRHAWLQAQLTPLVSAATATELMRVLGYPKFKLSSEEQQELLADYLPYCVTVRNVSRRLNLPTCRDPFDLPFLQLAAVGKAAFLVTGDNDLLTIRGLSGFSIVTAEQLREQLSL